MKTRQSCYDNILGEGWQIFSRLAVVGVLLAVVGVLHQQLSIINAYNDQ